MNLFIMKTSKSISLLIKFKLSILSLKVKDKGFKRIFNSDENCFNSSYYPNEIYINGDLQNEINYTYKFNKSENVVELIWNNNIYDSKCMFAGCYDIVEIDLTKFDSSQITCMYFMFGNCYNLI